MKKRILIVAAVFISSQTQAQQDSSKTLEQQDTSKTLDEVVFTANKFTEKQSATGKVVTVITREQLEKSSAKTVAQLLNEQGSIIVNGSLNNAGSVQTIYMRGASSGRTLILMDGVPVNDPSMINNEYDLNLFALSDVDRIEICKGAQSTLYGSDAIAGVINIITIKADTKKAFNIKSTISGGNLGTFKGNVQLYGKEDKLTYSVRYAKMLTSGFSSAYDSTDKTDKSGYDNDHYDANVANAQLQWQATKELAFKTFVMYSQYKGDVDQGVFSDEKDYTINNNAINTGAGFTFKRDFITLTGNYQYSELKRKYLNDSIKIEPGALFTFEKNNYFGKTQYAEIYTNIDLGKGFNLLQGADYRYASFNQDYYSESTYGPYEDHFKDTSLSQTSLYASLHYTSKNKKLSIELGGRLNTHSRYGSNYTYTFNPAYNFTNQWRAFGSIASGFKAPSLYQMSLNPALEPEKSVNYEIGVQYFQKAIAARAVYFYRNIDNGIDYNYIDNSYFNYMKQKVNGFELELIVKPFEKLTITANYTYLSPKETTQNRLTTKDTITYTYLLKRPAQNFNLNIGFDITSRLYASLSAKYVGDRYDVGGYQAEDVKLDAYFLLGGYVSFKVNDRIKLFADAQNITNEKFFDTRGYNSIPFMYTGGITVNW